MEETSFVGIGREVVDMSMSRDTSDKGLRSVIIVGSIAEAREASDELTADRDATGASTGLVMLAVVSAIPLP